MPETNRVLITQAEAKREVAILAHMRQIVRAVVGSDGNVYRPVSTDHSEIILASASLRALIFDDTPAPMLLTFLDQHNQPLPIETLETDISMLLMSEIERNLWAPIEN